MSKYTTEVRYICESLSGLSESVGFNSIEETITKSKDKIFDDTWNTWDPLYKPVLEQKILRHFYTREIGFETYGIWKFKLNTLLGEIMPKYNKLYELESKNFNPLWDTDITRTYEGNEDRTRDTEAATSSNGTSTKKTTGADTNTTDSNSWNYYSDTPQGSISRLDNLTYLTNATHDTDNTTSTTEYGKVESTTAENKGTDKVDESINTARDYVMRISGKYGTITYGKVVQDYLNSLFNVDAMIIEELEPLFMQLW